MIAETARQCMADIGLGAGRAERVAALLRENRRGEAKRALRMLRCELMDELHSCQRRVDRLDWLIRETEKQQDD